MSSEYSCQSLIQEIEIKAVRDDLPYTPVSAGPGLAVLLTISICVCYCLCLMSR